MKNNSKNINFQIIFMIYDFVAHPDLIIVLTFGIVIYAKGFMIILFVFS